MACLISQEDSNLDSALVNFSIGSFIFDKTANNWVDSIYSKNSRIYADIIINYEQ